MQKQHKSHLILKQERKRSEHLQRIERMTLPLVRFREKDEATGRGRRKKGAESVGEVSITPTYGRSANKGRRPVVDNYGTTTLPDVLRCPCSSHTGEHRRYKGFSTRKAAV
jgi:hypothetical protein